MKKFTSLFLTLLFTINIFASDHVHDKAHMLLENNIQQLENQLQNSHVYIETLDNDPNNGLESFSINTLNTINQNDSFLILIVKNSHHWRITMHPTGFVGSALTQTIGDAMVNGFKRGDFYGALSDASISLDKLALNPPVKHTITTSTTHVTSHNIVAARGSYYDNGFWIFFVWLAFIAVAIVIIWSLVKFIDWLTTPNVVYERVVEHHNDGPSINSNSDARRLLNSSQRTEANNVFNSYSPAQRQQIVSGCVGSPYYYRGCYNDPYSFMYLMMMMNMMDNHYNGYYHQQYGGYGSPDTIYRDSSVTDTTTTTTSTTTDDYVSNDSNSDSSGTGGSWDSSTSSDSSYSSDSSGGGGSWDSGGSSDSSGGGFDGGSSSDSGGGGSW